MSSVCKAEFSHGYGKGKQTTFKSPYSNIALTNVDNVVTLVYTTHWQRSFSLIPVRTVPVIVGEEYYTNILT